MYLGIFENKKGVFQEFSNGYGNIDENLLDEYKNCKILFAWYDYGDYCGDAFVLFEQNGKLYEVRGSHCSCYGLEDQWDPEETSVEALLHFMDQGTLGYEDQGNRAKQLKGVLNRWKRKQTA